MFIGDIKTASPFKDLFPIKEELVKTLDWDMQKNGFDESKPIVLWESHNSIVIDGHTRLKAAEKAGLIQVPVVLKKFDDEEAALEYAIRCQKNRRNLLDQEILNCIAALDRRKDRTRNFTPETSKAQHCALGKSSAETASFLGISQRKVEQVRTVMDKAPEGIKDAVKSGEMTINAAYNKTVNSQKGTPESIQLAVEEIENINRVFEIIKERLNHKQIKELIKKLKKELANK